MKVKIIHGVRLHDRGAEVGEVVTVDDSFGLYLIGGGRAEKYIEPVKAVEIETEESQVAPVQVPQQVPAVETAKKSKKTEK